MSLEVQGLAAFFAFQEKPVFHDITLHIEPGEILVVMGRNGSGKTTFGRLLLGQAAWLKIRATGQATLDGHDLLFGKDPKRAILNAQHIGYVPQLSTLVFDSRLNLKEDLMEAQLFWGLMTEAQAVLRLHELGEELLLPLGWLDSYAFELSMGMQQRALLAGALLAKPKLLILDEPTSALDVTTRNHLLTLVQRVAEEGTAVLLISHDTLALKLAQTVVTLA